MVGRLIWRRGASWSGALAASARYDYPDYAGTMGQIRITVSFGPEVVPTLWRTFCSRVAGAMIRLLPPNIQKVQVVIERTPGSLKGWGKTE